MDALSKLDKKELKELLSKGWMTHDAMWLYHCLQECGAEQTNRINTAAVDSMSQIEIQRIKKALGIEHDTVDNFEELVDIMTGAMDLVKADFMRFEFSMPQKNILQWEWKKEECFAYEGIKKIGMIDKYKCGIMVRIEGWLKGLGVEFTMNPVIDGCLMHTKGSCTGQFEFNLN